MKLVCGHLKEPYYKTTCRRLFWIIATYSYVDCYKLYMEEIIYENSKMAGLHVLTKNHTAKDVSYII